MKPKWRPKITATLSQNINTLFFLNAIGTLYYENKKKTQHITSISKEWASVRARRMKMQQTPVPYNNCLWLASEYIFLVFFFLLLFSTCSFVHVIHFTYLLLLLTLYFVCVCVFVPSLQFNSYGWSAYTLATHQHLCSFISLFSSFFCL